MACGLSEAEKTAHALQILACEGRCREELVNAWSGADTWSMYARNEAEILHYAHLSSHAALLRNNSGNKDVCLSWELKYGLR